MFDDVPWIEANRYIYSPCNAIFFFLSFFQTNSQFMKMWFSSGWLYYIHYVYYYVFLLCSTDRDIYYFLRI